jgi:hypothetical protein
VQGIHKLQADRGEGLLLIPQWKNAHFYPVLRGLYNDSVAKFLSYSVFRNVFMPGDDPTSFFGPTYQGNIEVWYLNFSSV